MTENDLGTRLPWHQTAMGRGCHGIEANPGRGLARPRSAAHGRQANHEAAAVLRAVGGFPAVPPRDLSHQREAEAGVLGTAASRNTIERREQTLARLRGDYLAAIGYAHLRLVAASLDRNLDRRLAVQLGVLDQIADHAP